MTKRQLSPEDQQAVQQALSGKKPKRDYSGELIGQIAVTLPRSISVMREFAFDKGRRWKLDVALWTEDGDKLAVEVEGVVYPKKGSNDHRLGGRHVSVTGMDKDCEKYAALAIAGWRLIRVMPKHVKNGMALKWIEQALKA